ncbi:MAG: heme ABC transporter ATP-binding protein [Spirochaetaceae bacterium]
MVEARNVCVDVGETTILSDVSLNVKPGEVFAVTGPNGAGKSTLLRVLCGDLTPSSGSVHIDSHPLSPRFNRDLSRRRAVVSQKQAAALGLRAFDVTMLGRTPHVRVRETEYDYRVVSEALLQLNADTLSEKMYQVLSGGEQQRVGLARAGAQIWDPVPEGSRYLLLDEPTSSLDLAHQHIVLQWARQWASRGLGVLVILHDLNLAARYADRMTVLCSGRQIATGAPRSIITRNLIHDVFETDAIVQDHPCYDCPLIVALGPADLHRIQNETTHKEMHV